MSAKYNADPKWQEKTRNLLADGNTADALLLLFENGFDQAISLKNRLDEAFRNFEGKRIDFDDWSTLQNQVNYEVLTMLSPLKPSQVPVGKPIRPGPIAKQAVLALLDQNKISEALDLCGNLGNDQTMLKARYHAGQKYVLLGLVPEHKRAMLENQIRFTLQELIQHAPEIDPKQPIETSSELTNAPERPKPSKNILKQIKAFLRI